MARGSVHGKGVCVAWGHAWWGACVVGGMHGGGGAFMAGGVHGRGSVCGRGHVWQGGHVWQEGMHGRGCMAG